MQRHQIVTTLMLALTTAVGQASAQSKETLRGAELFRTARVDEARPVLVAAANAGDPWANYWLGRMDFETRLDSAVTSFERAVAMGDSTAEFHFWLGRAYGAQADRASIFKAPGLAKKVRREWEYALALDPKNVDAREGLVAYHLRAPTIMGGDVGVARTLAAEGKRLDSYRGGILAALVADHEKEWAALESEYRALIKAYPDSAVPVSRLGTVFVQQQQWDQAFAVYDALLARQPDNPVALYGVGKTAAASGKRLEDGRKAFHKYLTLPGRERPVRALAYLRLGNIEERRGDLAEAKKAYQAGLALAPDNRELKDAVSKLR